MNVNDFYRDLFEDKLGLDVLGLESRYRDLVNLINRTTLLTFSTYIPCTYAIRLDLGDQNLIIREENNRMGRDYYISDPTLLKFGLQIIEVLGLDLTVSTDNGATSREAYYSTMIPDIGNFDIANILLGAEASYNETLIRNAVPFKRNFSLKGSNVLYLLNYPLDGIVEVKIRTSFPNIASIPVEYKEVLMNLAKLDIKIKLYNELKYLEDIVTPSGNLSLRISDWESAERDRDDYIKDLRIKSFPDRVGSGYFTIV